MRRLWAHIVLAFTALVLLGTTFASVFTKSTSNIEYQSGKEITYRISDKEDASAELDDDAASVMAAEFEKRLAIANISRYEVVTEGKDTIKVTLSQDTEDDYSKISAYLAFNGSLALTTSNNHYVLGDEFLTDEEAYLDDINGYPTVVIPVDTENASYKDVVSACESQRDNSEEGGETSTDDEGNETTAYYLYMWYDYVPEYDLYEYATDEENEGYDQNIAQKLFMKFSIDNLYYPDDENNKLASSLNVTTGEDGTATPASIRSAYASARFYVNLINASELPYDVEIMYTKTAEAWVENSVSLGQHVNVAWSRTFIATICAVVILSLLLVVFYRLGALSVATMSIASVFAGVASIVIFSVELNIFGIVGLAALALASMASGVVYLTKLKEEAYRGRSLKKANAEASKKSTLPIVDINVVLMLTGIAAYGFSFLSGGILMRTYAAVTVLGSLVSLILNTLCLKGMMWLATNATGLTGKYEVFGIDSKKIPNLMNEEKQSYFGPYADKDFTKKKKPLGIIAAVLFVATLGGSIFFGVKNDGVVYKDIAANATSEIFFEVSKSSEDASLVLTSDIINEVLEHTFVYDESGKQDGAVQLKTLVSDEPTLYSYSTIKENVYTYHYVYVVGLKEGIDGNEKLAYFTDASDAHKYDDETLNDTLVSAVEDIAEKVDSIDVKQIQAASKEQPRYLPIFLAAVSALGAAVIYLLLRYRLSRGLAALVLPLVATTIAAGIFALIRVPVGSYVAAAIPFVLAFSLIISIIFMNREREMVIEDKSKDNSVENRNEIMKKANSSAYSPILLVTILALYLSINFFGFGPSSAAWMFLTILLGCLIAAVLITTLFGPLAQAFYKMFYKADKSAKPRKKSKKKTFFKTNNKSAEPEEAIFIGIND